MNDIQLAPEMLALVPLVAAVLQVMKKIPIIDSLKEYMPFIAMVLSIGAVYAVTTELQIMPAVVMGLMASGAYDGVKAISK